VKGMLLAWHVCHWETSCASCVRCMPLVALIAVLCSGAVTLHRPYRCMCRHVCATASVTASLPRSELARNFWLTLSSASSGQSLNQSMVQQLIRDGNCRHLQDERTTRVPQCWQTTH